MEKYKIDGTLVRIRIAYSWRRIHWGWACGEAEHEAEVLLECPISDVVVMIDLHVEVMFQYFDDVLVIIP